MKLSYDLHLHSCLSPCGDDSATPASIAGIAKLAGLDIAALSDHNTTRNCPAFLRAAEEYGLLGIPAMELTTAEEAHILCLLPDMDAAMELDRYVYERLPNVKNRADAFGRQLIMNEDDEIIGEEERLLVLATSIGVYEAASLLRSLGGIAIPAHIDRESFSVVSNLGAVSRDMGFEVVEMAHPERSLETMLRHSPELLGMPYIVNSDAHSLENIPDAGYTLDVQEMSAAGVIEALRHHKMRFENIRAF